MFFHMCWLVYIIWGWYSVWWVWVIVYIFSHVLVGIILSQYNIVVGCVSAYIFCGCMYCLLVAIFFCMSCKVCHVKILPLLGKERGFSLLLDFPETFII